MRTQRILGILLIVLGAILIFFSDYIAKQVAAGKLQIEEGQRKVDETQSLFSVTPYTKPIGKELTKSGQRRIDAGSAEVQKYKAISNQLKIGGIVLIAIGIGVLLFWRKKRKK